MDTNTQEIEAATEAKAAKPAKVRHVAIIASTEALAEAMKSLLAPKMKNHTFSRIAKISERPDGAAIASLGLPPFVPGNEGVTILSFGSRIDNNATPDSRKAQWAILRNPEASVEDVLAELGRVEEYSVLPGAAVKDLTIALSEVRCEIAEAETPEDQLAAYKRGYELLLDSLK